MVAFLVDHPGLLAHGHALELGAGPGAAGLALAAAGLVDSVTLTDLEAVLPLTRENVEFASRQSTEVAAMLRSGRLITSSLCWCVGCDGGDISWS
jgi:methylase of polypeptide subunit release factors